MIAARRRWSSSKFLNALIATSISVGATSNALAEEVAQEAPKAPPELSSVSIPSPSTDSLSQYVKDKGQAILLGKALFWDMAVGSDGVACASCHFHAGADNRIKNQLSPGLARVDSSNPHQPNPDKTFQPTASGGQGGPNYTLLGKDFPFHQFNDPDSRSSGVKFSTNDISSSQGTFSGIFDAVPSTDDLNDLCARAPDPVFHVAGTGVRKVEPRNTPTMINAVFNFRNFWDGRANNSFNGVDPFGKRSETASILRKDGTSVKVDLRNASLASQAVGPIESTFEKICAERKVAQLGRKLIPRKALALQKVHADDSVLGSSRASDGKGLSKSYKELIEGAFQNEWWESSADFNGFTQMESNFSLFWGLALNLYQSTLVSDEAPYDNFAATKTVDFDPSEGNQSQLTAEQRRGLDVFLNKGKCINCHKGSEFSSAASHLQKENEENGLVERMIMGDGNPALYDNGFYNIGVTPTNEDIGVGGRDPFGNPLSFTKQYLTSNFVDPIQVDSCTFEVPFGNGPTSPASIVDWVNIGSGVSASGNSFTLGGTAYQDQINSVPMSHYGFSDKYRVSWTVGSSPAGYQMVGLGVSESGASYTDIDYAMYNRLGSLRVYESGTNQGEVGAIANGSKLAIEVDSGTLRYLLNGNVVRTVSYTGTPDFYIDSWYYSGAVNYSEFTISPLSNCSDAPSDLANKRAAILGAFKTPILRNVELTGPYMHNGGMATLEQVVEFYNRGGNFQNSELDPDIQPLGLNSQEKSDLVEFMKSLTDPRVKDEKAPFDHPQLFINNGHPGDEFSVQSTNSTLAANLAEDDWLEVPAIGRAGRSAEGLPPLKPFLPVELPSFPVANPDTLTVAQNTSVTIDPLANDTGSGLVLNAPNPWSLKGGTVALVDNKISYKSNSSFAGTDKIWYNMKDSADRITFSVITITVTGENNFPYPSAGPDTVDATYGESLTIDALANDIGNELTLDEPNAWSWKGGTVALVDNKIVYSSKAGFNGTDKIWYSFKDSLGRSNSGEITINVTGGGVVDFFPIANPDNFTTSRNTELTLDILGNDSTSGGIEIDTLYAYTAKGGTTSETADGQVLYTPKANFTGEDNFWYVMIDGQGRRNSAQVTIKVTP